MKLFYAVLHKDEDSSYGVHFPGVPGCVSAADEKEDVLSNAIEALTLYYEEEDEISEPLSLSDVQELAKEDLAEGAALLAVPLITRSTKQVRANISMDAGMLEAIDRAAEARKMTRSSFLVESARNEIEGRHGAA